MDVAEENFAILEAVKRLLQYFSEEFSASFCLKILLLKRRHFLS